MTAGATPERATTADLLAIVDEQDAFWGGRDVTFLHPLMLVKEFGEMALVVRDTDGRVIAYLLGVLTLARAGYIHVVAVREGHREQGLARVLYRAFAQVAGEHGARSLRAITQPTNRGSIAFHRALGFTATEVEDYSGPGVTRVVFTRALSPGLA
jgi:ribosomal protein S18 acetylase RimI-like enzyme